MTQILYPGILIESQDSEEASYFCACRAATANYPCPKCLVYKLELHHITKSFEPQTSESMRSVLERASQATSKTAKEKILQDHGDIKVSRCIKKTNLILFEQKALALLMGFSVLWSLLSIFIQHITFRWSWEIGKAYMGTCSQGFGGQKELRKIDVKVSLSVLLTDIHHPISSGWNFSMRKFPTWNFRIKAPTVHYMYTVKGIYIRIP